MNRDEYTTYFNDRQPHDLRKISTSLLRKFEEAGFNPPYNKTIQLLERLRKWITSLEPIRYNKLAGIKQERKRDKSDFFNYRNVVTEYPSRLLLLDNRFLGKNTGGNKFYYWAEDKTRNYFTAETLLRDFLALNLGDTLNSDARNKVIKFVEQYGIRFISKPQRHEDYFRNLLVALGEFRKVFELSNTTKGFPYCKEPYKEHLFTPPYSTGDLHEMLRKRKSKETVQEYKKWREVGIIQARLQDTSSEYQLPLSKPERGIPNFYERHESGTKFLYAYVLSKNDEIRNWKRCPYCHAYFSQRKRNQLTCSTHHAKLTRDKRHRTKKSDK